MRTPPKSCNRNPCVPHRRLLITHATSCQCLQQHRASRRVDTEAFEHRSGQLQLRSACASTLGPADILPSYTMRLSSSLRDDRRRRSTWPGLLTVLAAGMLTVTKAQDGIIRGEIFSQPRQPMPEHKIRALREARMLDFEGRVPLHAGYGTHFAYLYVGTPAQRVSVIIDTGSHWTAFPCTGCK